VAPGASPGTLCRARQAEEDLLGPSLAQQAGRGVMGGDCSGYLEVS